MKKFNINLEDLEEVVIDKVRFILKLYQRYRRNFEEKASTLSAEKFPFGAEGYLLIQEIDGEEFFSFLMNFMGWLNEVMKRII